MRDKNGKLLNVGDQIATYMHDGLLTITDISTKPDIGDYMTAKTADGDSCGYDQPVCACEVQKVRTWKELAQEALRVQDASNLSGVANSFGDVVREVRVRLESEGKKGNAHFHSHPVVLMWADKIASLTGIQGGSCSEVYQAYTWADEQVKK